jgi:hypothetical protein
VTTAVFPFSTGMTISPADQGPCAKMGRVMLHCNMQLRIQAMRAWQRNFRIFAIGGYNPFDGNALRPM